MVAAHLRSRASAERLRNLASILHVNDLAAQLNPIVAGWMHYDGRIARTYLHPLLARINSYLMRRRE
jgi:hypothetical protein